MTLVSSFVKSARPVTPLGILAAKLESLSHQLETLDIDAKLKAELRQTSELASGLDPYLSHCTTPESPALASLVRRTQAEDWSQRFADRETGLELEQEMLSGHVEGQFLKFLVHVTQARRVLEIGMFTGYSALVMAEALPADGEVVACEVDAYVAEFAQGCFNESSSGYKISVEVAPAMVTLDRLAAVNEKFDLVFIDADKAGYVDYVNFLLDNDLLTPNGSICVDNTLMQGQPYLAGDTANGVAIATFNQVVAEDPRVEQVLLPLRDGLTLIRRV
jgi:caffeoyl-CoA O-methyltransferase